MGHEKQHHTPERGHEVLSHGEAVKKQHELEKSRHEQAEHAKKSNEHAVDEARQAVKQEAISGGETHKSSAEQRQPQQIRTREDRAARFDTTMRHVRQHLTRREKVLSTFMHQPAVEKVSDFTGKTIARPSGLIGGTVAAFVGLLSVYGVAKFAGFPLSGSEMPLLLLLGFFAGLFVEWAYKAARALFGRRREA